jgi:DNA-binding MarR family transcriptional regulator|tara:strand:- start:35990 stop:36400 length:411 start_codon:yes stop_codon:yes gene_type:complete
MLSEIERIFPNNCKNMKIDIDDVIGVRKNRSQLFNEQYFANKFWDIILVLYSQEVNDRPINAQGISSKLDIDQGKVLRYLKVLSADNLVCAYDQMAEDQFNIADDNLSLTRAGFENTATVIQQMRRVFGQSENQHS